VRDNAQDANLPRRIDGPREPALPAAAAAAPSSSASDRELPGRIDGPGGDELSASAAAAAAATGAQVRRTRLIFGAGAKCAGPFHYSGLI